MMAAILDAAPAPVASPWSGLPGEVYAGIAIVLAAIVSGYVASRGQKSTNRSASAEEVVALGERLDRQAERMDIQDKKIARLERNERRMRDYVYTLQRLLRKHGIEVPAAPEDLL